MQIETPVTWVQVDQQCDSCNIGRMRPTGVTKMTAPPRYEHRCNHCDAMAAFTKRYPSVEVVEPEPG
jgi:hypothetical protein